MMLVAPISLPALPSIEDSCEIAFTIVLCFYDNHSQIFILHTIMLFSVLHVPPILL